MPYTAGNNTVVGDMLVEY